MRVIIPCSLKKQEHTDIKTSNGHIPWNLKGYSHLIISRYILKSYPSDFSWPANIPVHRTCDRVI